jgi:hypothetical protein
VERVELRRRPALVAVLALAAAGGAGLAVRRARTPEPAPAPTPARGPLPASDPPPGLPWLLLRRRILASGPNARLGLVQGQHIFARTAYSGELVTGGLVRVRIPASLIRQGEDGWRQDRFSDVWWMAVLSRLGVPVKAVLELGRRDDDEAHAAHAARLVRHGRPATVIVGNELNTADRRPGTDAGVVIGQYLDRYAAVHAAIKDASPETRVQLYGEAYDGQPSDPAAFLRHVLAALRQRGLPPPDGAGIHVYDHAGVLPGRVAGYRQLLAEQGFRIPLAVEEMGPRQGVIDRWDERTLSQQPDPAGDLPNRLAALRADGWLTEAEHADLVAQQLATAAACADQAQVFCAMDFDAELDRRRGLVSRDGRTRPALERFRFLQRLLSQPAEVRHAPAEEHDGVAAVWLTRRDGLTATVCWSERVVTVPPYTFVCDAQGQLVQPPEGQPTAVVLPGATTAEAGGAVRVLI